MPVRVATSQAAPADWDPFVLGHTEAVFSHQAAWLEVVREVYGGKPYYLTAYDGDDVVGVLPLMERWAIGRGRALVSAPFADVGGICALSEDATSALLKAAADLGTDLQANHVELRQLAPLAGDLPCDTTRVVLRMPLPSSTDDLMSALSKNMRKKVRRSMRDGQTPTVGGAEQVGEFYAVYARNMRDLGSPMHSRRFFEALFTTFPGTTLTVLLTFEGQTIGAAVAVWLGGVLTVLCAHSVRAYYRLFPNNLLYWTLFECAVERGCSVADFGRSPRGTGIYEFKKLWGMEDHPLYTTFIPLRSTPDLGERREGLAYRAFSRVWRHTPLSIARALGPRLFARLPV